MEQTNPLLPVFLSFAQTQVAAMPNADWSLICNRNLHKTLANKLLKDFGTSKELAAYAANMPIAKLARELLSLSAPAQGYIEACASNFHETGQPFAK